MTSTAFPPAGARRTMASILADRLRHDVLMGELKPGARLTMRDLAQRYDAGAIPLREALSRLTSSGFIVAEDQRGFRVTEVSAEDVLDIQTQRAELECIALRNSIRNGSVEWEAELIASMHTLMHVQSRMPGEPLASNPDWEAQHSRFHLQLVAACGSKWLMRFIAMLIDHSSRYRQIGSFALSRSSITRDVAAEHKAILDATLARDADLACALLHDHYRRTTEVVLETVAEARRSKEAGSI